LHDVLGLVIKGIPMVLVIGTTSPCYNRIHMINRGGGLMSALHPRIANHKQQWFFYERLLGKYYVVNNTQHRW
jgi:hypothetical protein